MTENNILDIKALNDYCMKLIHYVGFSNEVTKNRAELEQMYVTIKEARQALPKGDDKYEELTLYEKTAKQLLMKDLVSKLKIKAEEGNWLIGRVPANKSEGKFLI
jgi:hypothetical protein